MIWVSLSAGSVFACEIFFFSIVIIVLICSRSFADSSSIFHFLMIGIRSQPKSEHFVAGPTFVINWTTVISEYYAIKR